MQTSRLQVLGHEGRFLSNSVYINYLNQLQNVVKATGFQLESISKAVEQLQARRLSLIVVGEFKKGKSTFINALLGDSVLPSDILPTTAVVNRIRFSTTSMVTLKRKDRSTYQIPIDQLSDHITKLTDDSADCSRDLEEAVLHYPLSLCRSDTEIIDTPGLNDDDEMSAVTLNALNPAQIAIVLTSAIAPFAESEGLFLKTLLTRGIRHLIFVVNQIDEIKRESDINRVLKNISQRIQQNIDDWVESHYDIESGSHYDYHEQAEEVLLYGLSAQQALSAKQNCDDTLLTQSRFSDFENALSYLIVEENRDLLLQQLSANVLSVGCEDVRRFITRQQKDSEGEKQVLLITIAQIENRLSELRSQVRKSFNAISQDLQNLVIEIELIAAELPDQLMQKAEEIIDSFLEKSNSPQKIPLSSLKSQLKNSMILFSAKTESKITSQVRTNIQLQANQLSTTAALFNHQAKELEHKCHELKNQLSYTSRIFVEQTYDVFVDTSVNPLYDLLELEIDMLADPGANTHSELGIYAAAGAAFGSILMPGIGTAVGGSLAAGYERNRRIKALKEYKPKLLDGLRTQIDAEKMRCKIHEYVKANIQGLQHHNSQFRQQIEIALNKAEQNFSAMQGAYEAKQASVKRNLEHMNKEVIEIQQEIIKPFPQPKP